MKARAERAGPNLRFPSRKIYRPIDWPNHRPHETFGQADSACRAGTLAQTHFGLESEGSQPDDDVQTNNEHRPAWHRSIPQGADLNPNITPPGRAASTRRN